MKSSKLIIIASELWNDEQLQFSKTCLWKGLEQVNKKFSNDNLFNGIQDCDIQANIKLENCEIDIVFNAEKDVVIGAISEGLKYDSTIILYVGEVTVPFGQWILRDGLFHSNNLLAILNGDKQKGDGSFLIVTPSPSDDWQAVEKKQIPSFFLSSYGSDNAIETDEFVLGITRFIDGISSMLQISPILNQEIPILATITSRNPSLYLFLDKGSSASPALLTLDGFAMLLNCGFNRNPESKRYLKYYQQIDVGLLSHVSYNNLLGLTSYAMRDSIVKINHLFVPGEISLNDKVVQPDNPFHVDLKTKLITMVNEMKNKGMQWSNLAVKAKTGVPLTGNNVKPIQLFHKIGYGSLEMIPLSPFEDDADFKKFNDEWKKSKYSNDCLAKTLPSTVAVLLVWKPFNSKAPIKRIIYIGSKCSVRKCFSTLITTLYTTYDFLKQAEYVHGDGLVKKAAVPRKTTPPVASTAKPPSKSGDNITNAKKTVPVTEKSSRPVTASAQVTHTVKDAPSKRPQTAGNKPKPEAPKLQDTKKSVITASKPVASSNTATTATTGANKKPQSKKTTDVKNQTKEINHTKSSKMKGDNIVIANGAHHIDDSNHTNGTHHLNDNDTQHVTDMDASDNITNGNCNIVNEIEPDKSVIDTKDVLDPKSSTADVSPIVAVGTVECAITEHGEADFCDDTPEELSADQMRQMGLYDDDDEDKGRMGLPTEDSATSDPGIGNIAHLPMEGSFYGKETVDANDAIDKLEWNQPLGLPMPVKDTSGNQTKKNAKCSTPIHVDCLCVPSDLDKDDLRYLFECVKSAMIYLQLEKAADLSKYVEILLEEKEKDGSGVNGIETTVIPCMADESYLLWARDNSARLESCRINISTDLTRRSITTLGSGDQANATDVCHGMKWEF